MMQIADRTSAGTKIARHYAQSLMVVKRRVAHDLPRSYYSTQAHTITQLTHRTQLMIKYHSRRE